MSSQPLRVPEPEFDEADFRRALSQFATGVTVITTRDEQGGFVGLTASSFNSVSLTPPLVLWSLSAGARTMPLFRANSHYVINVLAADQMELCKRFAYGKGDRFAGVDYTLGQSGLPVLSGALAWFECHNRSRYEEGDHVIFVGEVERCGWRPDASPLLFHGGRFYTEHPL